MQLNKWSFSKNMHSTFIKTQGKENILTKLECSLALLIIIVEQAFCSFQVVLLHLFQFFHIMLLHALGMIY